MTPPPLRCTVRSCALPLVEEGRSFLCSNRHSFDKSRSGYVNLLQPQDRRSRAAGDRPEAVAARRRLFDEGFGEPLLQRLGELVQPGVTVLDVGCGEGSYLGGLAAASALNAHGVDLSVDAIDLAARRYRQPLFVVANADRGLPYLDESFDVLFSITARRNEPEFARTLRRGGRAYVVVPAPDDLIELRQHVQGEGREQSRVESVRGELSHLFVVTGVERLSTSRTVQPEQARDLLDSSYRGVRKTEQARLSTLSALICTMSWDIIECRRNDEAPRG